MLRVNNIHQGQQGITVVLLPYCGSDHNYTRFQRGLRAKATNQPRHPKGTTRAIWKGFSSLPEPGLVEAVSQQTRGCLLCWQPNHTLC